MKHFYLLIAFAILSVISCKKEDKAVSETETTEEVTGQGATGEAQFKYHPETTKLRWTAFKTPEKVAVNGSFSEIEVTGTKESGVLLDVMEGAEFKIPTSSMTTGDESRDAKILALFFGHMASKDITGKFGVFENEKVPITINMNGVEIEKPFSYTFENNKLVITGVIDVIEEFKANEGFDLLHDACQELHMGKTWTDVSIEVTTEL